MLGQELWINFQAINDWVAAETGDKIKDLIKADNLDQDTKLVLVNAIYFKADWKQKFDKTLTKEKDFYLKGENPKKVPMMHLTDTYNPKSKSKTFEAAAIPALKSKMLRLPYKGDRIVMDILLPNAKENGGYVSVEEVEKIMKETEILQEFERRFFSYDVMVTLPKFKIESTHSDLETALKASGLTEMWCSGGAKADFSGIGPNLCVSEVRWQFFEI